MKFILTIDMTDQTDFDDLSALTQRVSEGLGRLGRFGEVFGNEIVVGVEPFFLARSVVWGIVEDSE
jgi:hypothetical protein